MRRCRSRLNFDRRQRRGRLLLRVRLTTGAPTLRNRSLKIFAGIGPASDLAATVREHGAVRPDLRRGFGLTIDLADEGISSDVTPDRGLPFDSRQSPIFIGNEAQVIGELRTRPRVRLVSTRSGEVGELNAFDLMDLGHARRAGGRTRRVLRIGPVRLTVTATRRRCHFRECRQDPASTRTIRADTI